MSFWEKLLGKKFEDKKAVEEVQLEKISISFEEIPVFLEKEFNHSFQSFDAELKALFKTVNLNVQELKKCLIAFHLVEVNTREGDVRARQAVQTSKK